MARPLRIEYASACYHVMNRGNQRQMVFRQGQDDELFLGKLASSAGTFGADVLAYCLSAGARAKGARGGRGNGDGQGKAGNGSWWMVDGNGTDPDGDQSGEGPNRSWDLRPEPCGVRRAGGQDARDPRGGPDEGVSFG